MKYETVEFQGRLYTRYPESKWKNNRTYYRGRGPGGKISSLHQDVWSWHNHQPVPPGYHVHHRDRNPCNNSPGNLELLSYNDHMRLHHSGWCSEAKAKHLSEVRHLGWSSHSTEEGKASDREGARKRVDATESKTFTCVVCGSSRTVKVMGKAGSDYCSTGCRKASGVDDVERTCAYCGDPFKVHKYKTTTHCSRACVNRDRPY